VRFALAIALFVVGCSNEPDPKTCRERIARFEQRLVGLDEPTPVAIGAHGYDIPRVPRARALAVGTDGIVINTGYDKRVMWMRGFGVHEAFRGKIKQGYPDVNPDEEFARFLAELPAPPTAAIPVYIVVPVREHEMIHLVDGFARIDPIFELRLVVGIEGTEKDPTPADASASLRKTMQTLAKPHAAERSEALAKVEKKAFYKCEAMRQQVRSLDPKQPMRGLVGKLARTAETCGCGKVDVPALETLFASILFAVGSPEVGWIPLDLHGTGSVQQFASSKRAPATPEPGLGKQCSSEADCPPTAAACVPFDADGTWYPGKQGHCTRPCGDAGCPDGFRCTREVTITGVSQYGQLKGEIVSTWCGPIAPRETASRSRTPPAQ
jgi:hypothetical protein